MTHINAKIASKHYNSVKGEIEYLERIQFADVNEDGEISLLADEEGNSEIILTARSAKWLAYRLLQLAYQEEHKQ